jgi:RimJ/RimL family protein N-acetyltransferase
VVEEVATLNFKALVTSRLEVRPPREADRARLVELWCDADFMVFSSEPKTEEEANRRFDHMIATCQAISFAKQPIIERSSGIVIGYTGVDHFTFEGQARLEWGYRLVHEARGMGYATEASRALLARAHESFSGELVAMIDPANRASQNVCRKLGFDFLKRASVDGYVRNIYTLVMRDT